MKSLFECVHFCAKQGLSFRGHRDDYTAMELDNKGNFIELVQFRARIDEMLRTYIETAPGNTSKTIQNEMMSVVDNTIRNKIIKETYKMLIVFT